MISANKPTPIEVIEQTLMVFRVRAKNCLTPASFKFDYPPNLKLSQIDFKVFLSTTHTEPNEKHHEKMAKLPSFFALKSDDKEGFFCEYIYISLYSVTGCSVTVTVRFPEPLRKRMTRRIDREDLEDEEDKERRAEEEVLLIKQQRRQYAHHRLNFIKKNMEDAENFLEILLKSDRSNYN